VKVAPRTQTENRRGSVDQVMSKKPVEADPLRYLEAKYLMGGVERNSHVHLDQEAEIFQDLENGYPILLRSLYRQGASSMMASLAEHRFGPERTIRMYMHGRKEGEPSELASGVAQLIDSQERDRGGTLTYPEIVQNIQESGKSPIQYLDEYLIKNDAESVLVHVDETVAASPDDLAFLASAKGLKKVKLVVQFHWNAKKEPMVDEQFGDFQEHSIRPLTRNEVAILVRGPIADAGVTIDDAAI